MVKGFNWTKVNKQKLIRDRGIAKLENEADRILAKDKAFEKGFKKYKGFKPFFNKWNKENKYE
jgi:hypothetical protein